ncbi:MAG: DUF4286 family protein [Ignavibacteriales bacterium]|nr:MAG: DUF4286 family protein [Ignavibacteriales bacterium]
MILYSVTISVKKDVESEWKKWMNEIHLSDVMATGYFYEYKFYKVSIPAGLPDESTYIVHYKCKTIDDYVAYAQKEANRLREEHSLKFPGKFTAARAIMEEIKEE